MDDVLGERLHYNEEHSWGLLPSNQTQQIGLAKIADSVRELGFRKEIELQDIHAYEVETVPVIRTHTGTFVRLSVSVQGPVAGITAGMGSLKS